MPIPLTAKQRDVYLLAVQYYAATAEPCSLMYLARRLKRHHSTVQRHLSAIEKKGWFSSVAPAFACANLKPETD